MVVGFPASILALKGYTTHHHNRAHIIRIVCSLTFIVPRTADWQCIRWGSTQSFRWRSWFHLVVCSLRRIGFLVCDNHNYRCSPPNQSEADTTITSHRHSHAESERKRTNSDRDWPTHRNRDSYHATCINGGYGCPSGCRSITHRWLCVTSSNEVGYISNWNSDRKISNDENNDR